jgi:flagellar operon protein
VSGVDVSALAGIERATRTGVPAGTRRADGTTPAGFDSLLDRSLRGPATEQGAALRWSAHAVERLAQARIPVGAEMQRRLQGAVDDLAAKGARESLVLMDGLALVVSVSNRTVITAVGADRMKDQIFTNIDSAAVR